MQDLTNDLFAFLKERGYTHPPYLYGNTFAGKVPYSGPFFDDAEIKAALDALLFGKWSVAGENVFRFEREFAAASGHKHGLMVNSGSSANLVLIAALKERYSWVDGDEIIVSVVGFPTTVSVIAQAGLRPVFVDIELDSLNIDVNLIEAAITPRTKAIFLSPVLGNPPDVDKVLDIAKRRNLVPVLDGCDSFGTKWRGQELSTYFVAASCSFYPSHHLCTLGGGMVTSTDEELVDIARSFAAWGRACYCQGAANLLPNGVCGCRFSNWLKSQPDLIVDHKYVYDHMGYNVLPLDLQGAIGREQLKKAPLIHSKRREHKELIAQWIAAIPGLRGVKTELHAEISWFGTPVVASNQKLKEELVKHLEFNGIQTRSYFAGNLLLHPGYEHLGDWRAYPNANEVLRRVFFIGCWPGYTEDHLNHIKSTLASFVS